MEASTCTGNYEIYEKKEQAKKRLSTILVTWLHQNEQVQASVKLSPFHPAPLFVASLWSSPEHHFIFLNTHTTFTFIFMFNLAY